MSGRAQISRACRDEIGKVLQDAAAAPAN